jgi:antitoxin (DNA-binding transcriptional repressor) of toxin-antitoxin stability system
MAYVTIHEAKTNFPKPVKKAFVGEEVIIARENEPLVKLLPLVGKRFVCRLGGAKDMIQNISEDFDAPLEDFKDYM